MSEGKVKKEKFLLEKENFEMLQALYNFDAVYQKTISFHEDEFFVLHQTSTRQRNWLQVVSERGNIGFVPSNYVQKLTVEPAFLLEFLETVIINLKRSDEEEINNIISREQLISNLIEKKLNLEKIMKGTKVGNGSLKHASDECVEAEQPPKVPEKMKKTMSSSVTETKVPPQLVSESPSMTVLSSKLDDLSVASPSNPDVSLVSSETSSGTTTTTTITVTSITEDATIITKDFEDEETIEPREELKSPDEEQPMIPQLSNTRNNSNEHSSLPPSISRDEDKPVDVIVEEQDVYQIVESIRKSTNLSHELSQTALRVVISEIGALVPDSVKYLEPIAVHLAAPLTVPDNLLGDTHDAQRLRNLFQELADAKNDSEQRSWMLYEDETDITNYLTELIRILVDADAKICRYEMSCDGYNSINNLVQYYQMESRWNIRKLLLRAFKAMCLLDITCVEILISSVLPLELAQDMLSNQDNLEKLSELSVMLIMIFSAGSKMPTHNFDHMKSDFMMFMLNLIENPLEDDATEFLCDVMINLLLAFNLQFDNIEDNSILEALQQVKTSKSFTEKILLLINREEDPVFVLKHTKPPVNTVLKMLVDLFSIPLTASLFYTNDVKVLIDILVRQLSDLSCGDPLRRWYLELCRRILRNTDYCEHQHRALDLMKIFTRIFCEDTPDALSDQKIVREISNEFPQIFKA